MLVSNYGAGIEGRNYNANGIEYLKLYTAVKDVLAYFDKEENYTDLANGDDEETV